MRPCLTRLNRRVSRENADPLHEASLMKPLGDPLNLLPLVGGLLMWNPSLPVLRKKLAGTVAIPGGEPSGPLHMFRYNYLLPHRTIHILLGLLKKSYVPRTP